MRKPGGEPSMNEGATRLSQDILEDARALLDFNQLHHELRPCSVGIGLGSHDPEVADVTAALFHRGVVPLIVFTGAKRSHHAWSVPWRRGGPLPPASHRVGRTARGDPHRTQGN